MKRTPFLRLALMGTTWVACHGTESSESRTTAGSSAGQPNMGTSGDSGAPGADASSSGAPGADASSSGASGGGTSSSGASGGGTSGQDTFGGGAGDVSHDGAGEAGSAGAGGWAGGVSTAGAGGSAGGVSTAGAGGSAGGTGQAGGAGRQDGCNFPTSFAECAAHPAATLDEGRCRIVVSLTTTGDQAWQLPEGEARDLYEACLCAGGERFHWDPVMPTADEPNPEAGFQCTMRFE